MMSAIKKMLEKPIFRYAMLTYILLVIASGIVFYFRQQQEIRFSLSDRIGVRLEKELASVKSELYQSLKSVKNDVDELKMFLSADTKEYKELISMLQSTEISSLEKTIAASESIDQFSTRVEQLEGEFNEMKKALNPTEPQVLSITRLGDKFELLLSKISSVEAKLQTIEKETEEKLKRNYDLAAAQVDRIVDMLKWLGLLLIPIIFTTIRELFTPRKPASE